VHGTSYNPRGRFGCPLCREHHVLRANAPERERTAHVSPVVVLVALGALLAWVGPTRIAAGWHALFPERAPRAALALEASPAAAAAATRAASWPSEHELEAETMVRCGAGVLRGGMYASCSGSLGAHERPLQGGEYFLPERRSGRPLPVLIFLHGVDQSPASVLAHLSPWAERHHFVLIAPEAGLSGWSVPDSPERTTPDALHVLACLLEVQSLPAVALDRQRVLVAGVGGGGAEAAYLATNHSELSAFAVLGGALVPSSLGPLRVPAWLSTREQDPALPPQRLLADATLLARRGFDRVERAVVDSHDAPADEQLRLLVGWWLDVL
jgi:predicted esterase